MMKYILVLTLLFPASGFALTTSKDCALLFEDQSKNDEVQFLIDTKDGVTDRFYVGSRPARPARPARTAKAEIAAMRKGGKWWGVSVAIRKNIEEARAHDKENKTLGKLLYAISDLDTSSFSDATPREEIQKAFEHVMATSDVWFFHNFDENGKELPLDQRRAEKQLKAKLKIIMPSEDVIWFTKDPRGNRFHFFGWTFSQSEHGIVDYNHIFKLVEQPIRNGPKVGLIESADIRKALRDLDNFLAAGGTITFNENFEESLARAKNQLRKNSKGEFENGSRYMLDPTAAPMMLEHYKNGYAISSEARMQGHLLAGSLALKIDNVVTSDTVFYYTPVEDTPFGTGKNYSNLARAVGIAEAIRLHQFGINYEDVGMVTDFTKQGGGILVPAEKYELIKAYVNSFSPMRMDELTKPFTRSEIPFERWRFDPDVKPPTTSQIKP